MTSFKIVHQLQGNFKICAGLSSCLLLPHAGSLDVGDAPASCWYQVYLVQTTMYPIPFFENLQAKILFECLVGLVIKSLLPALRLRYSSDFPQYSVG
jgi:hypothetical protein